jgi:twitching motility two-component system response regulator PilG
MLYAVGLGRGRLKYDNCGRQSRAVAVTGRSRERQLAEQIPLQGVKVMVIDDSNTIRRSAEIFLLQAGCTVILADDGFDALAKIADHQPDLVFVDIMMPRLDGYQTCALIKKNSKFQRTPVVMLSSKDGLFDRARGRMVGSDQYLTKPFTKESLLKAVAAHVNRAAA